MINFLITSLCSLDESQITYNQKHRQMDLLERILPFLTAACGMIGIALVSVLAVVRVDRAAYIMVASFSHLLELATQYAHVSTHELTVNGRQLQFLVAQRLGDLQIVSKIILSGARGRCLSSLAVTVDRVSQLTELSKCACDLVESTTWVV